MPSIKYGLMDTHNVRLFRSGLGRQVYRRRHCAWCVSIDRYFRTFRYIGAPSEIPIFADIQYIKRPVGWRHWILLVTLDLRWASAPPNFPVECWINGARGNLRVHKPVCKRRTIEWVCGGRRKQSYYLSCLPNKSMVERGSTRVRHWGRPGRLLNWKERATVSIKSCMRDTNWDLVANCLVMCGVLDFRMAFFTTYSTLH